LELFSYLLKQLDIDMASTRLCVTCLRDRCFLLLLFLVVLSTRINSETKQFL